MYFFLKFSLSFILPSHKALIILQQATRKTHPRAYQCFWDNYIVFALNCYNFGMGCLYIHVCLKMRLCLKIRFSTSFDITWYAEAATYPKNLLFSQSIFCLVKNTGEAIQKNWLSVTQVEWNRIKSTIQVTYFLNGPIANLFFYSHVFIYWEKVFYKRSLANILPLK